jgi:hypothetical protein
VRGEVLQVEEKRSGRLGREQQVQRKYLWTGELQAQGVPTACMASQGPSVTMLLSCQHREALRCLPDHTPFPFCSFQDWYLRLVRAHCWTRSDSALLEGAELVNRIPAEDMSVFMMNSVLVHLSHQQHVEDFSLARESMWGL